MSTAWSQPLRIRLAFIMWCLTTPPPMMMAPAPHASYIPYITINPIPYPTYHSAPDIIPYTGVTIPCIAIHLMHAMIRHTSLCTPCHTRHVTLQKSLHPMPSLHIMVRHTHAYPPPYTIPHQRARARNASVLSLSPL